MNRVGVAAAATTTAVVSRAREDLRHMRHVPDCIPTSGLVVYLLLDAALFLFIVAAARYALVRYADTFERWGIVDMHDSLPFWIAMVGCPVGVSVMMPLFHRRWSYLERPHLVVTALIGVHVMVLRYFGNPPMLPIVKLVAPVEGEG
jgi:hypothetical protein